MPMDQLSVLVEHMHSAAERLIAAFAEEQRLAELSCKHPDDSDLFNQWARSRQAIEDLQKSYDDAFACCRGGSRGEDRSEDQEQAAISKENIASYSGYANLK
jgi:hypothetical protein